MAAPTVSALPEAPDRTTDTPETFSTKADAFAQALIPFRDELNQVGSFVDTKAGEVNSDATNASNDAAAAATSASDAQTYRDSAQAASDAVLDAASTNFPSLTGNANKALSVMSDETGVEWAATLRPGNNLSDVDDAGSARTNLGVPTIIQTLQAAYPVGSIYLNATNGTNPATLLGFGTWSKIAAGRVLLGDGGAYTAGDTGGAETHTLTQAEIPPHGHTFSAATSTHGGHGHGVLTRDGSGATAGGTPLGHSSGGSGLASAAAVESGGAHAHTVSGTTAVTGGGGSHNNMQPFLTVYMWQRTA